MSSESILIVSIFFSLLTSGVLWWWLKGSLRDQLGHLCHKGGDTEFWARYTLLMLVLAPLAVVVLFVPSYPQDITNALRYLLLSVLFSHIFSFALVGRTLFKAAQKSLDAQQQLLVKQG